MPDSNIVDSKIIVALDYADRKSALNFVDKVNPDLCKLKIGKELFTAAGPALVTQLTEQGFRLFLDLKFHDIPNTVMKACQAAAELGVWMLNVHALGGKNMLLAAKEGIDKSSSSARLIAVTILTSMSQEDLSQIGIQHTIEEQVISLASMAQAAGLDGVVCSAKEVVLLRQQLGQDFLLVTPGIRPAGSHIGDQKRVMTPHNAIQAGSSYLVIGRPITQADDPVVAIEAIQQELG